MTTWRKMAAVATLVACVAPACGGGGGGGGGSTDAASVLGMLELIPDEESYREFVQVGLYDRGLEQAGIEKPSDAEDTKALGSYLAALGGVGDDAKIMVPVSDMVREPLQRYSDASEELGFSVLDLAGDVTAGQPPELIQAARGSFDADAIDKAVHDDEVWSDVLETRDHSGVDYYRWLDDNERDLERTTGARPVGQSSRLAVGDGALCYASTDAAIEAAIDARRGEGDSLAESDDFGAVARALDRHDAHGAFLLGDSFRFTPEGALGDRATPSELSDIIDESGELLADYELLGVGGALDGDQSLMIVTLLNDDESTAKDNADRLERIAASDTDFVTQESLSDLLNTRSVESDGRLTIGVFEVERPFMYYRLLTDVSNLFWHE